MKDVMIVLCICEGHGMVRSSGKLTGTRSAGTWELP